MNQLNRAKVMGVTATVVLYLESTNPVDMVNKILEGKEEKEIPDRIRIFNYILSMWIKKFLSFQ